MPIFPELTAAIKSFVSGFGDEPLSLDIEQKGAGGISFDAVNAGWYARNGFPQLYSMLSGGMPAWSGEPVSTQTALAHSVVWACNRIISESVGFIPAIMLQSKGDTKLPATNHPMYGALKNAPNDEITAQGFSEMLTSHCVLEGNAFAKIIRRSSTGTALELHAIQPQCVVPDREKEGQRRLIYVVKDGNSADKTYTVVPGKPHDLLHIRGLGWDGIRGYSVIQMAKQSIGTSLSAERNVARFYAAGGRVPYLLEMQNRFKSDADFDKFRSDWQKTYSEPHAVPILENGTTYKQTGLNAVDSQQIQMRQYSIGEICRWFGVSPHLVQDLSKATFSNVESLALEFVKMTLAVWLNRWEQELWRCVLTPDEKSQGYFFKHNLNSLLRGDFASRMAGYSTMLQNGYACIDEVRDLEDWNPLPNGIGKNHFIQLNMQPVDKAEEAATTPVKVGNDEEPLNEDQTA